MNRWHEEQHVFNAKLDLEMKTQTREEFCSMGNNLPAKAQIAPEEAPAFPSQKAETSFEAYTRISQTQQQKRIKVTKAAAKTMVKTNKMKKISDHFTKRP
jgi:hypothetical protein